MSRSKRVQIGVVVVLAVLLAAIVGPAAAYAAETTATIALPKAPASGTATASATQKSESATGAAAKTGETPKEEAAEGAAAGNEAEKANTEDVAVIKEVTHKPGTLTQQQLQDIQNAFLYTRGYNLLIVAVLGLFATLFIICFAAYKQINL